MAIRDQRIDIGHGIEKVWRVVYDYRSNPLWRLQTGYVRYDNNQVPVWRPYDPADGSLDADWRNGVWHNIHRVIMPHDDAKKHVSYQTQEYNTGTGESVLLPGAEVRLTYLLVEYLDRNALGR